MKNRTPAYIFIPLTLLAIIIAFMVVMPSDFVPRTGFSGFMYNLYHQFINIFSHWVVWMTLLVSLVMLLIINGVNKIVERNKFVKLTEEEQQKYLANAKEGYFKRLLRSSREKQSDEEEESIILDHGFDGIKELDNSLPQWWLALFYFGCIFMVVYVIAYFTTDFADPYVEYEAETAELTKRFDEYREKNDIKEVYDERNVNLYQDEAALQKGEEIFQNVCATCHTANGGGSAGPNLTDDYWINKLEDSLYYNIFNMVYNGSPNNPAMQAFGQTKQIAGIDIQKVASYVYYLNQVKEDVKPPEGLEPQGDLVPEWSQNGAAATTSTTTPAVEEETPAKTDSLQKDVTTVTQDSVQ